MRNTHTFQQPQNARNSPVIFEIKTPVNYEPDTFIEPIEIKTTTPRKTIDVTDLAVQLGNKALDGIFWLAGHGLSILGTVAIEFLRLGFGLLHRCLAAAWKAWTDCPSESLDNYGHQEDPVQGQPEIHVHVHFH